MDLRGKLWHNQTCRYDNNYEAVDDYPSPLIGGTVGMLYDGIRGTLSYFLDGIPMGVGFEGLHLIKQHDLRPVIISSYGHTPIQLVVAKKYVPTLSEMSCSIVCNNLKPKSVYSNYFISQEISKLDIPRSLGDMIGQTFRNRFVSRPHIYQGCCADRSCFPPPTLSQLHSPEYSRQYGY